MRIRAEGVLEDRRGDEDLSKIAAGEVHLAHDHRDDLDRGDRQRDPDEERGRQPPVGVREQSGWGDIGESRAEQERRGGPEERNADRGPADLPQQPAIDIHSRQQEQEEDAELGHSLKHRLLRRVGREQRALRLRPDEPEKRRAEDNSRQQLADDRRLSQALGRLAEEARRQQDDDERREEPRLQSHGPRPCSRTRNAGC